MKKVLSLSSQNKSQNVLYAPTRLDQLLDLAKGVPDPQDEDAPQARHSVTNQLPSRESYEV